MTAGNASGLNDGAAALMTASVERALALGVRPLCTYVGSAAVGVDPRVMGIGPVPAVRKLLQRTGVSVGELDLVELNEAFASLCVGVGQGPAALFEAAAAVLAILLRYGIEYDADRAAAIHEAFGPLRRLGLDAALLIHEDGGSVREAEEYLMRWGVMSRECAQSSVRFVVDPNGRAYVISYLAGGELARSFHRNDPARFRRLLTEQIRVGDLLAPSA